MGCYMGLLCRAGESAAKPATACTPRQALFCHLPQAGSCMKACFAASLTKHTDNRHVPQTMTDLHVLRSDLLTRVSCSHGGCAQRRRRRGSRRPGAGAGGCIHGPGAGAGGACAAVARSLLTPCSSSAVKLHTMQRYDTGRGRAAPASQGQQLPQAQGQAGAYMDLAQALVMLNALPSALRGCLLEAARLCGSAAGGAQAHLLSMHWAAQARSHDDMMTITVWVVEPERRWLS